MKKKYFSRSRLLLFLVITLYAWSFRVNAQQATITTSYTSGASTSLSSNAGVVFAIQNTNGYPVVVNDLSCYLPANNTSTWTLWYSPTEPLIGAPTSINTTNGWIEVNAGGTNVVGPSTAGIAPLLSSLNFIIPGNTTYRCALVSSNALHYYDNNASPNSFLSGGVSLLVGNNNLSTGYTGAFPNLSTNTPRSFNGTITFEPFMFGNNNAGISSVISPIQFCSGTHSIDVELINSGKNLINNVAIHWELDGVAQPTINYTTPLDTAGSVGGNTATIVLGNHTFTGGPVQLKVYTSNPNGVLDTVNGNDTLYATLMPSLSGTYTIDQSSPASATNFTSFTNFATALNTYGVCGPVVANVVATSGLYNERVSFGNIPGSSAVNTIRINGNGANVEYVTTTTERQLLTLSGTKYLRIDNVNFQTTTTTDFGWGALITQGAEFDSITNCTFDLSAVSSTSSANSNGIVFSNSTTSATGAGVNGTNCYIANNHLIGPSGAAGMYYGIAIASGGSNNNIIFNNEIENYYSDGVYLNAGQNTLIEGNRIHCSTKTATYTSNYGINTVSSDISGTRIVGNRIYNPAGGGSSTSVFRGLNLLGDGTAGSPVIVANNLIYDINQGGATSGIYLSAALYNKVYHNTIDFNLAYSGTGANYGIYATGTNTDLEIKNNIVSITEGSGGVKYGFYYSSTASISDAQRNNFYVNSNQSGTQNYGYYTTAYTTQGAFQTAYPLLEIGSLDVNPLFANPSTEDYTPTEPSLFLNGVNVLSDVPADINGLPRTATPTPGAFQRGASGVDNAGVNGLAELSAVFCSGNQNVNVIISNNGTAALNNVTVEWEINGVAQTPFAYTGLIDVIGSPAGNVDTVTIGQYNFTASTNLKIWTVNPNGNLDVNNGDDTLYITVSPSTFTASISNDTVCVGDDITVSLGSNGSLQNLGLQWELSTDSVTFGLITGADSLAYNALNLTNDSWYRASITTNGLTCYSDTVGVRVMNPQLTGVTGGTHCGPGTVTLSATGIGYGDFNWYDSPTAGTYLGSGANFTTPFLTATDTFYVGAAATGGVQTYSVGLTVPQRDYITQSTGWGLHFDVHIQSTIDAVAVYPNGTGTITILILDPSNNIIYTGPVTSVTGTGFSGSAVYVPVGVTLPPGSYKMGQSSQGITNLGAENIAPIGYPFSSPLLSITAGSQGTGFQANVYYWFYDWQVSTDADCESPRQMAIATITAPPSVTTTVSQATICKGNSTNLNVTSVNPGYTYEWLPGNLQGAAQTVSPDTTTSYILRGEDQTTGPSAGCVVLDTVLVTVDSVATPIVLATPDTLCGGEPVQLSVLSNIDFGQGNSVSPATSTALGAVSPFHRQLGGMKSQYLILASELLAEGLQAGSIINGLGIDVVSATGETFEDFAISLGHTTSANLSGGFESGLAQVFYFPVVQPVVGINTIPFNTGSFVWDGVSNIVVQTCWSKNTTGSVANTATVRYDVQPFVCQALYRVNNQSVNAVCGNLSTTATSSNRPWFRLVTDVATPNYTYQWTPSGATTNIATVTPNNYTGSSISEVYSVTVEGPNSCTSTSTLTVLVNPQPTASILSGSTVICSNNNTGFFIDASSSTNANSYLWLTDNSTAPSYQVTGAGTYILEVENTQGCRDWDTIVITEVTPVVPIISVNYQGSQAVLDAGPGYASYLWNTLDTTQTIVVTNSGQYSVTVIDANGCEVSSAPINLSISVEEWIGAEINLFPNPNKGTFTLSIGNYQDQDLRIDMYDLSGRIVYNQLVKEVQQEMQFAFDVSTLSDGMYMLKLSSKNSSKTLRFTIVK